MYRPFFYLFLTLTTLVAEAAVQLPTQVSSPKFIKRFNEKYLTVNQDLSTQEQKAIDAYINDGYAAMNSCLRKKKDCSPKVKEQIKVLQDHLRGFFIPGGTVLYRGNGKKYPEFLKNLKAGATFIDEAFVSTSLDPMVAKKFTAGVFDIIEVPKGGITGKRIRSRLYDEREVLLSPGLSFKVLKKVQSGKILIRYLRIVTSFKTKTFFNQIFKQARPHVISPPDLDWYVCYPFIGNYSSSSPRKNLGVSIGRPQDYKIRQTPQGRLLLKPENLRDSPLLCLQKVRPVTLVKSSNDCTKQLELDLIKEKEDFLRMCEANHFDHCESSDKITFARTETKKGSQCHAKLVMWGRLDAR